MGERLTGEHDPRDPDGLLTVDQIAGGTHGASPERNFTLTTAEMVRALVAGPPAWSIRKRR